MGNGFPISLNFSNNRSSNYSYTTSHTEIVYQIPPETQNILNEQRILLSKYEEKAKRQGNPKLYEENFKKLLDTFIKKLPSLELTSVIDKKPREHHIGFIGAVSSGKTSMINALFQKDLPVALGHCTDKCEIVHMQNNNIIWDVCGHNDDYKFYNPINLSFVKDLDKCVILFDNDIMMISNILKVVYQINASNMVIIRSKVDQHNEHNVRTIQEERMLDKQKIKNLLGIPMEIYYISSHNITKNLPEKFDWLKIKQVLNV